MLAPTARSPPDERCARGGLLAFCVVSSIAVYVLLGHALLPPPTFTNATSDSWGVDLGPLSVGTDGVNVRPALLLGVHKGNMDVHAGVSDLRGGEGLKVGASMDVKQTFKATGSSLTDFLVSLRAEDESRLADLLNPILAHIDSVVAAVLKRTGVDVSGPARVEGTLQVKVGVGAGAAVALGWRDAEGYRMVGAGGDVAALVSLGASVFAGVKDVRRPRDVKLQIGGSNFEMKIKIKLPPSPPPPLPPVPLPPAPLCNCGCSEAGQEIGTACTPGHCVGCAPTCNRACGAPDQCGPSCSPCTECL